MNKKNIYLATAALCVTSYVSAQQAAKDSTLSREMLIEKEFIPIVRDANKINKLPEVETPAVSKAKTVYSTTSVSASPAPEIAQLSSGDIKTLYPYSNKRGYLGLGSGNTSVFNADLGYRILDTKSDYLGLFYNMNIISAKLDYVDFDGKTTKKVTDNIGKAYYKHNFSNWSLFTDLGLDFYHFNYYGYDKTAIDRLDENVISENGKLMQDQTRVTYNLGFKTDMDGDFNHHGNVGIVSFSQKKYKLSETALKFGYGFDYKINEDTKFLFDAGVNTQMYGGAYSDYYKTSGVIRVTPGFLYNNDAESFVIKGGINFDVAYGRGSKFGISPTLDLNYAFVEKTSLYATATGRVSAFSLSDAAYTSRYVLMPDEQAKNSYTVTDFTFGLRSDKVAGLFYDIYAGLSYTANERFIYSDIHGMYISDSEDNIYALNNRNALSVGSESSFGWKIGAALKYETGIFRSGLRLEYSDRAKDYVNSGRSKFEMGLNLGVQPTEDWLIEADWNLYAGRKIVVRESINLVDE